MSTREFPERTVFLAGAGRSGTTWLARLLDASPTVLYKHEPDNIDRAPWFRGIPSRLDATDENDSYRDRFAKALEEAFWSHSLQFINRPEFPKMILRNPAWRVANYALRAWRKAGLGERPSFRIPRWIFRKDPRGVDLVVKSVVSNLRLAWIRRHFPEFRLVLIIRHPCGYLSSWMRGAAHHGWTGFGERSRLDGTILPFPRPEHEKYAKVYESGGHFERELIYWIIANETPFLELAGDPAFKAVIYEELCAQPEKVVREVYEHSGIPFDEQTRRFVEASTARHLPDFHGVFKNPKIVANRWRGELTPEHINTVERYLAGTSLADMWS